MRLVSVLHLVDLLPDMKTPLQSALHAACLWLKRRPGMKADPDLLLEFTSAWILVAGPCTEKEARQCGIHAVREVACCVKEPPTHEFELIEPEDLHD